GLAGARARASGRAGQGAPAVAELARRRRLACTAAQRDPSQVDESLSDRWFELTTARIDAMKSVEDYLESRLHGQCAGKLAEAREGLAQHQSLIASALADEVAAKDAYVVFCGTQGASYHSEGVSPRLGRSIVELVQSQSRRLQTMQDELAAARAALEERKLMERAKVLLMKHRKLTEEQAYRLLRQMAMNQSRRLVDVAQALVSMQDMWE